MAPIYEGGPAFARPMSTFNYPGAELEVERAQDGMSQRDYFAAHAPKKPAEWFTPVLPAKPSGPPVWTAFESVLAAVVPANLDDYDRSRVKNVLNGIARGVEDEGWDFDEGVAWLRKEIRIDLSPEQIEAIRALIPAFDAWRVERDAALALVSNWESERDRQYTAQWPWAWADAVLAAKAGPTSLMAGVLELLDALKGMVGLVQLIQDRELELRSNHRFIEAQRVIDKAEGR